MARIDITNRVAAQRVVNNPALRGQPLHIRAGLPSSNFRLIVGSKVGAGTGDALRRNVERAIRTGIFKAEFFTQPQAVRAGARFLPRFQRLAPATIRALEKKGILKPRFETRAGIAVKKTETPAQKSFRLARERRVNIAFGRAIPSIGKVNAIDLERVRQFFKKKGGPFAVGVTREQLRSPFLQGFNVLFQKRVFSANQLDVLSRKLDIEGRKLDRRITEGTATQAQVNKFNVLVNEFNRQASRTQAKEFREFFKERPSPRKPAPPTIETFGDLTIQEAIPVELGGKGVNFIKSAREFERALVNLSAKLPSRLKNLERTREGTIKGVGFTLGLGFAGFETLLKIVVIAVQEGVKVGGIVKGVKFFVPKRYLDSIKRLREKDLVLVTNPLKFIKVSKDSFVLTPRAIAEFSAIAGEFVLLFQRGAFTIAKATKAGKPGQKVAKLSVTTTGPKVSDFANVKIKNLNSLSRSIKRIPEIKAVTIRVREDIKAFVGVKKAITSTKINTFLSSVNKELRSLRKKLGPIIKDIKLSQKGLAPKKTTPSELRRLSSSQARAIQTEKLNDARILVNKTLRDLFLTRNVRKKFGPITRIIKLGRKKGLSPSGSVLRFAREKVKGFVDPRRKQLNAVGIDVNSFALNLTDDLVKKLLPRKLARSLKKKFPELSKRLAIGKKRGVRKRIIVKRLIKKRTITILNRTFLNQKLGLKVLKRVFNAEVKEVIGLFKTLSNFSKASVRGEFNNFLSAVRLVRKIFKQPRILLTEREINTINKWNISRTIFLEKVGILFRKKIPRKIRKSLGPIIKTIKLREKGTREFIKKIKASNSLLTLKLKSLFSKLSSNVKASVRPRHIAALQRSFNTRQSIIKKILGKQMSNKQAASILRELNNDIERLKKAEVMAFRARTRARNARRANNLTGVKIATKQEQNVFFNAIRGFEKFEARVRKTVLRKFKEPKPRPGEKIIKTKTGQLQIVKVKVKTRIKPKVKIKPKIRAKLKPRAILILRPREKVVLSSRIKRRAISAARARQLNVVRVKVRTRVTTAPKARAKQLERLALTPKSVTIIATRILSRARVRARQRIAVRPRTRVRTRVRPRLRVRAKLRPLIPIPNLELGLSFSQIARLSGPFNVIARVRGKIRTINRVPLSGSQALAFGGNRVDNKAIRSFAITKGKGKVRKIKVPPFNPIKFRKPAGNTKLQRFFIVEKTRFAIDTRGEKREITAKGIRASRLRKRRKRVKRRRKK